jgi:hypothetical protein
MKTNKIHNDQDRESDLAGLLTIMLIALLGVFVGLYLGLFYCGMAD